MTAASVCCLVLGVWLTECSAAGSSASVSAEPLCPEFERQVRFDTTLSNRTGAADSWLGRDKLRHLATSVVLAAVCCQTAQQMGLARSEAQNLAALSTLAAGLLKEERDRRRTYFSWKDLVADAVGIALGVMVFTY